MNKAIYLDYNATAPLRPEALATMTTIMAKPLNASAVHSYGQEGRKIVEQARRQIATLAQTDPAQIIFNSGATEGNNTVLRHFADERILVSAIEHDSILKTSQNLQTIPVTHDGIVNLNALEALLKTDKTGLVSVMWANNETGIIQPIEEISKLAHRYGALFHCDAVQAAGRMRLHMNGIDFLTLSSHKIGGPQGVGALILGLCGQTPMLLEGGGQEKQARAGTENVAGIAGFGIAVEISQAELTQCTSHDKDNLHNARPLGRSLVLEDENAGNDTKKTSGDVKKKNHPPHSSSSPPPLGIGYVKHMAGLQSTLEYNLKSIAPDIIIYGQNGPRLANTTLFSVPGTRSESLLMNFDLAGIALSNGSACSSGSVQPSHVLNAMGRSEQESRAAIRVSTGWATTQNDIDALLNACEKTLKKAST